MLLLAEDLLPFYVLRRLATPDIHQARVCSEVRAGAAINDQSLPT